MNKNLFKVLSILIVLLILSSESLNASSTLSQLDKTIVEKNSSQSCYSVNIRCGECSEANHLEYRGYYDDPDETYFYVTEIFCWTCGSETRVNTRCLVSDLGKDKIRPY